MAITSLQKYSIHDGDGIRTTVFFKGCPLRCTWCHNPETQSYTPELLVDQERCSHCGCCQKVCESDAIQVAEDSISLDVKKCILCGKCTEYCPLNLREIMGKELSIPFILKEVKKDEMFYEESGGGVTLSGGEVMTQDMDFVEKLLKAFKKAGISVTIDTCGYAPFENFKRVLPYTDTFLYDIKAMDKVIHQEFMGVDNTLILQNLEALSEAGARIYIRIPVIKGVNANKEFMEAVILFLREKNIHVAKINLLPYHNTGSGKYKKMGLAYDGANLQVPTNEEMESFLEMFVKAGFQNTKIGG